MKAPTYAEQERKIHEAYIKDEIIPMSAEFCFCGTLSTNGGKWIFASKDYDEVHYYTLLEYQEMEAALFSGIYEVMGITSVYVCNIQVTEDALFNGMVRALKVLKKIHERKGEVIDIKPIFVKRKLTTHAALP